MITLYTYVESLRMECALTSSLTLTYLFDYKILELAISTTRHVNSLRLFIWISILCQRASSIVCHQIKSAHTRVRDKQRSNGHQLLTQVCSTENLIATVFIVMLIIKFKSISNKGAKTMIDWFIIYAQTHVQKYTSRTLQRVRLVIILRFTSFIKASLRTASDIFIFLKKNAIAVTFYKCQLEEPFLYCLSYFTILFIAICASRKNSEKT